MTASIKTKKPAATMDYRAFLERKTHLGNQSGFAPLFMPDFLFPFQRALTTWAVEKGRCAIFAGCGLVLVETAVGMEPILAQTLGIGLGCSMLDAPGPEPIARQ